MKHGRLGMQWFVRIEGVGNKVNWALPEDHHVEKNASGVGVYPQNRATVLQTKPAFLVARPSGKTSRERLRRSGLFTRQHGMLWRTCWLESSWPPCGVSCFRFFQTCCVSSLCAAGCLRGTLCVPTLGAAGYLCACCYLLICYMNHVGRGVLLI
jgi:hypothetical protein